MYHHVPTFTCSSNGIDIVVTCPQSPAAQALDDDDKFGAPNRCLCTASCMFDTPDMGGAAVNPSRRPRVLPLTAAAEPVRARRPQIREVPGP